MSEEHKMMNPSEPTIKILPENNINFISMIPIKVIFNDPRVWNIRFMKIVESGPEYTPIGVLEKDEDGTYIYTSSFNEIFKCDDYDDVLEMMGDLYCPTKQTTH